MYFQQQKKNMTALLNIKNYASKTHKTDKSKYEPIY